MTESRMSGARSNLGMGDRLRWCQDARPCERTVQKRVVAAAAQKCVLWALTNRSNADGSSFPRQALLAEETGLSRQSVNAALQALAEQEFLSIEIDPDHRRSRRYILNMSRPATHRGEGSVSGTEEVSDQGIRVGDEAVGRLPDNMSRPATHRAPRPVASRDTDLSRPATPIEPPVEPKTSPTAKSPRSRSEQPTNDSIYLAERINERSGATKGRLVPSALQRFVTKFGANLVEDAIRELHGFPPEDPILSPYAYLAAILTERTNESDEAAG